MANSKISCADGKGINVKQKFTQEDSVKFLELYESQEVLWNFRHKDYKNKDVRDDALRKLQEAFNLSQIEVKNKIKNFRSTYTQEVAKIKASKTSGASSDDVYKPTLIWFAIADRFLKEVITTRKSKSNLDDSYNEMQVEESSQNITPGPSYGDCESDSAFLRPEKDNKSIKKRKHDSQSFITAAIDRLQNIKAEGDEFDLFGANIATQLRALPMEESLNLQIDIMTLISKRRIAHLRPMTPSSSSRSSELYDEDDIL